MAKWTIHKYDEEQDLHHINKWLKDRKHPEQDAYDVPDIGYVACFANRPIAAGFLKQMEGENSIFDGLCSNPLATSEFRNIALDMVVGAIITLAKSRGIKQIIGWSIDEGTLKRAYRHDFVKLPHTLIALDLKNGPSH